MPQRGMAPDKGDVAPVAGFRDAGRALERNLGNIVCSAEPAVVLSSLGRCCSTWFSDTCAVELSEGTQALFRVRFPMACDVSSPGHAVNPDGAAVRSMPVDRTVVTRFHAPSGDGYAAFAGVFTCGWHRREPTEADAIAARLLVDKAIGIIGHQRLAESAARAEARAAQLAIELITARVEGEATGVLMATHHVSNAEALLLLRKLSRTTRQPLDHVAAGLVHATIRSV